MLGFVTFVYLETVKIILAKGNPHFICESRVLVKPYKEKGKIPDKYRKQQQQLQQMERGDFSACNSPTALDPRDPFNNQLGSRMLYNNTGAHMEAEAGGAVGFAASHRAPEQETDESSVEFEEEQSPPRSFSQGRADSCLFVPFGRLLRKKIHKGIKGKRHILERVCSPGNREKCSCN